MNKFNEINIKINRARITDIDINFPIEEDLPKIVVRGQLVTESGMDISGFTFLTDGWNEKTKFDAPASVHAPIRKIFDELLPIIYEKINGMVKQLSEGEILDD